MVVVVVLVTCTDTVADALSVVIVPHRQREGAVSTNNSHATRVEPNAYEYQRRRSLDDDVAAFDVQRQQSESRKNYESTTTTTQTRDCLSSTIHNGAQYDRVIIHSLPERSKSHDITHSSSARRSSSSSNSSSINNNNNGKNYVWKRGSNNRFVKVPILGDNDENPNGGGGGGLVPPPSSSSNSSMLARQSVAETEEERLARVETEMMEQALKLSLQEYKTKEQQQQQQQMALS